MTERPGPPGSLLNLDPTRPPVAPVDAATLVLLRDGSNGLEVFCVERNRKSRFMGGALVFPGGKVDAADRDPAWQPLLRTSRGIPSAHALAACRESLEEAAILPVVSASNDGATLTHAEALELRQVLAGGPGALREALAQRGLHIDLDSLVPFARWITPAAEARRFDAHFFMLRTPDGQDGAHDEHETMASFWATPTEVLSRWRDRRVQLAPPTHRTLELLTPHQSVDDALEAARGMCLDPICPVLVDYDNTLALTLPGDPDHPEATPVMAGATRYVLRDEQWVPLLTSPSGVSRSTPTTTPRSHRRSQP